ncbi:Hypothetical protein A7982_09397 [Minicystis rosea]|nr:Hypothetical protein A7982_09397 [Minicystis rosea]
MRREWIGKSRAIVVLSALALTAALANACGEALPSDTTSTSSSGDTSSSSSASSSGTGGAGGSSTTSSTGTGGTGGAPDCVTNPTTHVEIINACTDAQQIDSMPVLPLLQPDGGLPPLP